MYKYSLPPRKRKKIVKYSSGQELSAKVGIWHHEYFENGAIKAVGIIEDGNKEGEWRFYRKNGLVWQIVNYHQGIKNGLCTRYDAKGNRSFMENFVGGVVRKPRYSISQTPILSPPIPQSE